MTYVLASVSAWMSIYLLGVGRRFRPVSFGMLRKG